MPELKTKSVFHTDWPGEQKVLINEDDFDPAIHSEDTPFGVELTLGDATFDTQPNEEFDVKKKPMPKKPKGGKK